MRPVNKPVSKRTVVSQPKMQPQPKIAPTAKFAPVLAAIAFVAAGYFGVQALSGPSEGELSAAEKQAIGQNYQAAQPMELPLVDEAEVEQRVEALQLAPEAEATLKTKIDSGAVELRWLTVLDWLEEDGDVLRIESGQFSQTLRITNAGQRVAIPVANNSIQLTGLTDPGGGVTVAILDDSGDPLPVPPVIAGESVTVVVR